MRREVGVADSRFGRCQGHERSGAHVRLPVAAALFSGCKALPQVLQGNVIESWPYTEAVMVPSVPNSRLRVILILLRSSVRRGMDMEIRAREGGKEPLLCYVIVN